MSRPSVRWARLETPSQTREEISLGFSDQTTLSSHLLKLLNPRFLEFHRKPELAVAARPLAECHWQLQQRQGAFNSAQYGRRRLKPTLVESGRSGETSHAVCQLPRDSPGWDQLWGRQDDYYHRMHGRPPVRSGQPGKWVIR